MAQKQVQFDIQRLITEVATRHHILLKPDDAAFAIVTMNRLILEESLETIRARLIEERALFQGVGIDYQKRAVSILSAEVYKSATAIRQEIQRDVEDAKLEATEIVKRVSALYYEQMSTLRFFVTATAGLVLFLAGVFLGKHWVQWHLF
jgi:hypothetical protein